MLLDIPNIHGPTHDPQHVIAIERRDPSALIEFYGIPGNAVPPEKIAENSGMFAMKVLEDKEAHQARLGNAMVLGKMLLISA
jgi:hypothetical protein